MLHSQNVIGNHESAVTTQHLFCHHFYLVAAVAAARLCHHCPRTIAALKHSIREKTVMVWEEMTGTIMGRMHSKNTRVCRDGWKSSW